MTKPKPFHEDDDLDELLLDDEPPEAVNDDNDLEDEDEFDVDSDPDPDADATWE